MTADALIECDDVTVRFGAGDSGVHALRDVDLTIRAGELVVLRGPSGSGKTTLLNVLGGLQAPSRGRVRVAGVDIATASEAALTELRRARLGFVFQTSALLPMLTAAENVELPLRIAGVANAEREGRVREVLDLVGLAAHAEQRPDELSGGQQQRIGIARALAGRPDILIADEPTSQLDSRMGMEMMTLIADVVRSEGATAVVSTHDPRMDALADRVVEVRGGRVLEPSAAATRQAPVS